jgi:hypothetical protein
MRICCGGKALTEPFPSSGRLFYLIQICCLAANVSLFVLRSLPRNGSIRRNNNDDCTAAAAAAANNDDDDDVFQLI